MVLIMRFLARSGLLLVLLLGVALFGGLALAQSVADGPPRPLTPEQLNGLIDVVLLYVGARLVSPVTAIAARLKITCTIDAKIIAAVLSLAFVGLQGLLNGVYGTGPMSVVYAIAAAVATFIYSYGQNAARSDAAKSATLKAILPPADKKGDVPHNEGMF